LIALQKYENYRNIFNYKSSGSLSSSLNALNSGKAGHLGDEVPEPEDTNAIIAWSQSKDDVEVKIKFNRVVTSKELKVCYYLN